MYTLKDFDYTLPEELIAQYPLEDRSGSRLMIVNRKDGSIKESRFSEISALFDPGDLIIVNNTKVIPARLPARRLTGARVEVFLYKRTGPVSFEVLLKPKARIKDGESLLLEDGTEVRIEFSADDRIAHILGCNDVDEVIERNGKVPLPPYIKRDPEARDLISYQTVYAEVRGASAAPTAGLHFTGDLIERFKRKGVDISAVTLHTGLGTFAPVKEEDFRKHRMHSEWFSLDSTVIDKMNSAKSSGRSVTAVGTTVVRVLETAAAKYGMNPVAGYTDLFIYPPYEFKATDRLITNFHLPKSTLLMLVCALGGRDLIMKAYKTAVEKGFRFFSYGDAMIII